LALELLLLKETQGILLANFARSPEGHFSWMIILASCVIIKFWKLGIIFSFIASLMQLSARAGLSLHLSHLECIDKLKQMIQKPFFMEISFLQLGLFGKQGMGAFSRMPGQVFTELSFFSRKS
jgi:hypothetical protein